MRRFRSVALSVAVAAVGVAAGPAVDRGGGDVAAAGCPTRPTLAELIALDEDPGALTEAFRPVYGTYKEAALACYGDSGLTVRAFVAAPEGLGGARPYAIEPAWLASPGGFLAATDRVIEPGIFEGPFYPVAIEPGGEADVRALERQWALVDGHFDDPSAGSCVVEGAAGEPDTPSAEEAIEICRTSFVLDAIRAAPVLPETTTKPPIADPGSRTGMSLIAGAIIGALGWKIARRSGAGRERPRTGDTPPGGS